MTKLDAIEILTDEMDDIKHGVYSSDMETTIWVHDRIEAIKLAIDCIQDKINEEDSPYYHCEHDHCDNCLYSGRISG